MQFGMIKSVAVLPFTNLAREQNAGAILSESAYSGRENEEKVASVTSKTFSLIKNSQ